MLPAGDRRWAEALAAFDEVVDLEGALVLPAFVDAHVHTTSTGLALTGLDLTGSSSLLDCLDRVEKAARSSRGGGAAPAARSTWSRRAAASWPSAR